MEEPARKSVSIDGTERRRTKRGSIDWDAVERDYRTGKFTVRELGAKYNVSHQRVSQVANERGWTQDLAEQIRQATHARLVEQLVQDEVAKSGRELANTVLVAADLNAQVILRHRQRLAALAKDADLARQKLIELADTVKDHKDAATLVSAIESAFRSEKILIEQERKAFRLDDDDSTKAVKPKRVLIDFEDAEVKE